MSERLNKFLSSYTSLSRRSADQAIIDGRVFIENKRATLGDKVRHNEKIFLDGNLIEKSVLGRKIIMMNKPVGYVCSRNGQGNKTVYELLPEEYQELNCVGRLDKNSSGLLVFTNDGLLANELSHPKYSKIKIYEIKLDKDLLPLHQQMINDIGINLEDGPSRLTLEKLDNAKHFKVMMREGRNRQIRRTFAALNYKVISLKRTNFGNYALDNLQDGQIKELT